MSYKEIYIIRHNNGERNFKKERTVYNTFETFFSLEKNIKK